jgi:hypothetical protein
MRRLRRWWWGKAPRTGSSSTRRLRRKFAPISAIFTLGVITFALVTDTLGLRHRVCTFGPGQPWLSDQCGALSVPGFPTKEQRIEYLRLPPGDCRELDRFSKRTQSIVLRERAEARLRNPVARRAETPTATTRTVIGSVGTLETPFASAASAEADARRRAIAHAQELLCVPIGDELGFIRFDFVREMPDCRRHPFGGHVCSYDFHGYCRMMERRTLITC